MDRFVSQPKVLAFSQWRLPPTEAREAFEPARS